MSIAAKNICKSFGQKKVLHNVTVEAPTGSLVALLGPSGSGKTTLLRIIAGLDSPDSGSVHYSDDDITQSSARERNIGFVFQHYALFKHMTVFENVAFGLRVRRWPEPRIRERVSELLKLVRLDELAHRYPTQLSGGQKQRIALIRSLAPQPRVMLLDEPFGALDAKIRAELRQWLRKFHDEFHVTSLFVTHDQDEAFEVSDWIVIMRDGRVEQFGRPADVFEHPASEFVMDFLGNVNKIPVRLHNGRALLGQMEMPVKQTPSAGSVQNLWLGNKSNNGKSQEDAGHVYVRPHELDIERQASPAESLPAKIMHINTAGSVVKIRLVAEQFGLLVNVDLSPERFQVLKLQIGEVVYILPKKARIFVDDYVI